MNTGTSHRWMNNNDRNKDTFCEGNISLKRSQSSGAYTCYDGTKMNVFTKKNSYYCNSRNGGTIRGSEAAVMKRCAADSRCTGYDWRGVGKYGHLCRQGSYPGRSSKCCGYKLCKKN